MHKGYILLPVKPSLSICHIMLHFMDNSISLSHWPVYDCTWSLPFADQSQSSTSPRRNCRWGADLWPNHLVKVSPSLDRKNQPRKCSRARDWHPYFTYLLALKWWLSYASRFPKWISIPSKNRVHQIYRSARRTPVRPPSFIPSVQLLHTFPIGRILMLELSDGHKVVTAGRRIVKRTNLS